MQSNNERKLRDGRGRTRGVGASKAWLWSKVMSSGNSAMSGKKSRVGHSQSRRLALVH